MNLCINCIHCKSGDKTPSGFECHNPEVSLTSPVTGKMVPDDCFHARESKNFCGWEGKFFENRNTPPITCADVLAQQEEIDAKLIKEFGRSW